MSEKTWRPPYRISREQIIADTEEVLGLPEIAFEETEDVLRIRAADMDWDVGVRVYAPRDPSSIPAGPDGKKIGVFLLHGGEDDWRQLDSMARTLTGKYGYKVVSGTFPGRLYLQHPSRAWPGDTILPDGSVRTPIWLTDELIGREEYEVVQDTSMRWRYGTRTIARARPGTNFYFRLAAWPMAMEAGMIEANRRHLPPAEFSVYGQGHSTGGPMVSMLSQRIENFAGALAAEHSAFGCIAYAKQEWRQKTGRGNLFDRAARHEAQRTDPFNELYIRTWRDFARYFGPETLAREGGEALLRLPWLIEEVFEHWNAERSRPRFKCEYMVTHDIRSSLEEAARVTAARLALDREGTTALVDRYLNYARPLEGPDVKPVPPFLFGIAVHSRDHTLENYEEVTLPAFASFNPPAKATVTQFMAGTHKIWQPEEGLPHGIEPAVIKSWHDAIMHGFFLREG